MATKLVTTKDYLLLIDKKVEIKEGDICLDINGVVFKHENHYPISIGQRKIIAYYPLTKEAKELDLPLLPNPFEKQNKIEVWIDKRLKDFDSSPEHIGDNEYNTILRIKKMLKAQSKQFSLEDVKKAIAMAKTYKFSHIDGNFAANGLYSEEEIIQSLFIPKEFIPEYEYYCFKSHLNKFVATSESNYKITKRDLGNSMVRKKFKITINSGGKQELVGTYKY